MTKDNAQHETDGIRDASGRWLAPPQTTLPARPDGPWTQNVAR